jgi:hypothetical protein
MELNELKTNEIVTPEIVAPTATGPTTVQPVQRTISNMTEEEFKKRVAEFEAKRKEQQVESQRSGSCPVCAARKQREQRMYRFHDDIINTFRDVSVVSLDSCILCVQKHVARAMTYYEEMLTANGSGTEDGTASVNVKIDHLKVLGHLGCAIEESDDYPELHQMLIDSERNYRYEAIGPDWKKISEAIVRVEEQLKQELVTKPAPVVIKVK